MRRSSPLKISWYGTNARFAIALALILLWTSSLGCSKHLAGVPSEPSDARLEICQPGNSDQRDSFARMVMLSAVVNDPMGLRDGVLWIGAILKRCFPDEFMQPDTAEETKQGDDA